MPVARSEVEFGQGLPQKECALNHRQAGSEILGAWNREVGTESKSPCLPRVGEWGAASDLTLSFHCLLTDSPLSTATYMNLGSHLPLAETKGSPAVGIIAS